MKLEDDGLSDPPSDREPPTKIELPTLGGMPERTFLHTPVRQLEDELRGYLELNGSLDADDVRCTSQLAAYSTIEVDEAVRNLIERGEAIATPPTRERNDDLSFQTL